MNIIKKIKHKAEMFYRQKIVCDQYPMLTSISRKQEEDNGAIGLVYMLHHIAEKNPQGIPTNEDLKVSPKFLEDIIIKYKKQNFNFISLDQLTIINFHKEKPKRPFIAFTLDDGYLDNYTEALPVFERQEVPFCIFVATDFIDQKAILWWDSLEQLICSNESLKIENRIYRCYSFQERWDTFRIFREQILKLDQANLIEQLNKMFQPYNIDWYEPIRRQAMSWNQIKAISQHHLCTIGGHTVSHPALNKLSDDEFRNEISGGISKLESVIGKKVEHFAYPYGSPNEIGEREYQLISEFNFKTVFSSFGGCITENNKHQTTHLPRVYLHEQKRL